MIFLQTYRKNKNHDLLQTYTAIHIYMVRLKRWHRN